MLRRTGNAGSDVDRWLNDLAGLSNLVAVGNPTSIDNGARCTGGRIEKLGQLFDEGVLFLLAQTTTARNDDGGFVERRAFTLFNVTSDDLCPGALATVRNDDGLDCCSTATSGLGNKRFRTHQHEVRASGGEGCLHVGGSTKHRLSRDEA
ncbi:unannotated protein [freshwater metagenome]|uniref:Unannotated protein n=1 Tax=freshwater metagenome TaxID=449393 RepID=A0A6J7MRS1_9ZZZZ